MIRGIPPRTMSNVSRIGRLHPRGSHGASGVNRALGLAGEPRCEKDRINVIRKPREWRYQIRPSFKRVRGPLVDVFDEAEEVLIVVDLGGFTRGEISLTISPEHYIVEAARGDQQFKEIIELPANVDVGRSHERLLNGVLEIVLPRRTEDRVRTAVRRRMPKKVTYDTDEVC